MPIVISLTDISVAHEPEAGKNVYVIFERLPAGTSGCFALTQDVVRWMIQKALGGHQPYSSFWTEIESGIAEFLASRVLSVINPFLKEERLVLRNVDVKDNSIAEWFRQFGPADQLTFSAGTELGMIYAQVFLPPVTGTIQSAGYEGFLAAAPWIRKHSYIFAARVGETMLTPGQLAAIEEGDILLLDQTEIHLERNLPQGRVQFRSSQLKHGAIRGSLVFDESAAGSARITIEEYIQEGLTPMSEANKKKDAAPAGSVPEIVAGLEVPVSIEFARLSFTLEELAAVREGQIIEIEKAQPEVVDLSVDGKVIGSGKLVDVEGKLGVRVLKVVKSKA